MPVRLDVRSGRRSSCRPAGLVEMHNSRPDPKPHMMPHRERLGHVPVEGFEGRWLPREILSGRATRGTVLHAPKGIREVTGARR